MSTKFDITGIVADHFGTLVDYSTGDRNYMDLCIQFLLPAIIVLLYWHFAPSLCNGVGQSIDQAVIAAFSIFTALLFNLQVMMMGLLSSSNNSVELPQSGSGTEPNLENQALASRKIKGKRDFITEIFYNISYAILVAITLVGVSIVIIFFDLSSFFLLKFVEVYLVSHFLLVGLMVLKRTHSLFTHF